MAFPHEPGREPGLLDGILFAGVGGRGAETGDPRRGGTGWVENNENQCKNMLDAIRWAAKDSRMSSPTYWGAETESFARSPIGVKRM